jgi:hypothetical protein
MMTVQDPTTMPNLSVARATGHLARTALGCDYEIKTAFRPHTRSSRATIAAAIFGLVAVTAVTWSKFVPVKSDGEASLATTAAPIEGKATISPFDVMLKQGKGLIVEEWGQNAF